MLAAGFPDIKAQFEIELGAPLKHEQRSTCLIGASLIYFIFCLAVCPLWGLPPVCRIHAQPWFLTAQLAEGGSSCFAKICLLLGMFRKAAQPMLSLLGLMVCVQWVPCSVMFQSGY